ncbi:cytochrome P450 2U1-like [Glandiceps talaboti]
MPQKVFRKWAKVYDDVISVRMGTELVVVLNSRDAIREALMKQSKKFSARPRTWNLAQLDGCKGVFDAPWPEWYALRKYCLNTLHEFGMGRNLTEQNIQDESEHIAAALRALNNKPTGVRHIFMNAVSNIMCAMLFGRRFEYDDDEFKRLLEVSNLMAKSVCSSQLLSFIPALWHLPLPTKRTLTRTYRDVMYFIDKHVELHRKNLPENTPSESFLDSYLLKEKEYKENTSTKKDASNSFLEDPEHLSNTCLVLFGAGTDTTANALLWAVLLLCLHPEIQEKCFLEIEDVIGLEKQPSYSDRLALSFVEATILEVHRYSTVVPLSGPRATTEDVILGDHVIPKDTTIFSNIWAVHMDERVWENPDKFDPGRFLDEEGKVTKRDHIMPFAVGPRDCLGSELAKMELFLFLARVIQEFKFKLPDNTPVPSTEGILGAVYLSQPFKVIAEQRSEKN